jgi:hypothetical protein
MRNDALYAPGEERQRVDFWVSPVRFLMENGPVYLLWHADGFEDENLIAVYSTDAAALAAIDRLKQKPGFSGGSDKFAIVKSEINQGC